MTAPLLIDTHLHVSESKAQGRASKGRVQIVEYGPNDEVEFSQYDGDVDDALAAIQKAGFAYACVLNHLLAAPSATGFVERAPGSLDAQPVEHTASSVRERLIAYNWWGCGLAASHKQLVPFISLDPWIMAPDELAAHLRDMAVSHGARGVKVLPNAQHFAADDERMWPAYEACAELGLPIVSHSGTSATNDYSEPQRFARVLAAFPSLKLILAHLGGGAWRQSRALAAAYPNVLFDCCEIIDWVGSPLAPSQRELAQLIRDIGAARVLFGSDFPWYDLDTTVGRVQALPLLSDEEKELILGRNAQALLNLPDPAVGVH